MHSIIQLSAMIQNVTHKHASQFREDRELDQRCQQSPITPLPVDLRPRGEISFRANHRSDMREREGITTASFSFSRTVAERNNERSLISTLVYQNYLAIPEFPEFIITAVEHDPTVFSRSLDAQIRALMIEPLSFAPPRLAPKLIIIDGLDECANPRAQKYILQALAAAATQLNVSAISGGKPVIRTSFNASTLGSMTIGVPLDETYKPDTDIKTFLNSRFSEIRQDHPSRASCQKYGPRKALWILLSQSHLGNSFTHPP